MATKKLAEYNTDHKDAKAIAAKLRQLGFVKIGSGADAGVWAKTESTVIKILMPNENDYSDEDRYGYDMAEKGFLTFFEICQKLKNNPHVPRFASIGGKSYANFEINGTPYIQIAMERLQHIKSGTVEEAMAWALSEEVKGYSPSWAGIARALSDEEYWEDFPGNKKIPAQVIAALRDPATSAYYATLFATMKIFYEKSYEAGLGWDLHTENVMQRKDGTLVIVDPYYS